MEDPEQNDEMIVNDDANDTISSTNETTTSEDVKRDPLVFPCYLAPPTGTTLSMPFAPFRKEDEVCAPPIDIVEESETKPPAPEPTEVVSSSATPNTQDDSPMPANDSGNAEAQMEDSPAIADDEDFKIENEGNQVTGETDDAEKGTADTEYVEINIDEITAVDKGISANDDVQSPETATNAPVDTDKSPEKVNPSSEPAGDVERGTTEESNQQTTDEVVDDSIVKEEDEEKVCGMSKRKCFCITVLILFILVIGLGVGFGVSSSNKDSTTPTMPPSPLTTLEPTPAASGEPTSGPQIQGLAAIVLPPGKDFESLNEMDPEYMALQWMTDSDVREVPLEANSTELLERFALVTLYYATSGDGLWNDNFLWLTESSHCDWSMIECSADGSVKGLLMDSGNLTGTLPVEIFWNLKNIQDVSLGSNALSGSLPTEIGLWTQASFVNVEANAFEGEIPTKIGKMTSLTNFGGALNNFTGNLPSEIGLLSALTSLQVWENSLSGSLPVEVTNLREMQAMGLANNMIQGTIHTELGLMTKLFELQLFGNRFGGLIPSELGLLTELVDLGLSNNGLTGSIPTALGSLTELSILVLSNNDLSSTIPIEFGNMRSLEYLNVEDNAQISGTIPTELSNATLLSYFDATGCGISGSIPSEIGLFTSLTFLDVSKTPLDGTLPSTLASLSELQTLSVWGTKISGTVPSELSRLSNLSRIFFDDTELTGGLEDLFCDLSDTAGFTFWSDCGGFQPQIVCTCCTHCCEPNGSDCEDVSK